MKIFLNIRYCKCCITIWHYWFFNHGFNFQDYVCHDCHDLAFVMLIGNVTDIAIITVKNVDYHCIFHNISKSEAINLLKISVLADRGYV